MVESGGPRPRLGATRVRLFLILTALAVVVILVFSLALPAGASHTEQPRHRMTEVGFHPLFNTGFNTDVWAHAAQDGRLFAYVGTWGTLIGEDPCPSETDNTLAPTKSGVKIVDATEPANPALVRALGTVPGSQNNDVKVFRMAVPGAQRDILVHSLEPCGGAIGLALLMGGPVPNIPLAQTGFQLYDVTEPTNPVRLGTYNPGGFGTHNLFPFHRPDLGRSFVATVFNEQSVLSGVRGEVQFVEVTDPLNPVQLSKWELADAGAPCVPRGTHLSSCFLHDVWVSPDGRTAYLSFWDAGLILLDTSDPANPVFIGQALSQVQGDGVGWLDEEGNTHAAVPAPVPNRELVVIGDEDFVGPKALVEVNEAPADGQLTPGETMEAVELSNTRPLSEGPVGPLPALPSDDGFGCSYTQAQAVAVTLPGWIAVARRGGPCPLFQQKVTTAEASGADALIVADDGRGVVSGLAAGNIPAVMIDQENGDRLIATLDITQPEAVQLTLAFFADPANDPWGFMRVVDVAGAPADWREVSTFKAPHVDHFPQPPESVFSAHNPISGEDGRIYFSWYTDGVRVLDPRGASGKFKEVAWFVPLPSDHPDDLDSDPHGVMEDNIGFWGSFPIRHPQTGEMLVFNSDINRGLYILRMER